MGGPLLPDPTKEQRAAIDADVHALEIRAGAGTGKTLTLARRLARFAKASTQHRLLAVTFTRDATASLERKVSLLLGRGHGVRVVSFHQWAARELPPEARRFLPQAEGRQILLRALQRRPPSGAFTRALGVGKDDKDDAASRIAGFLSFVRNAETSVGQAIDGPFRALAPWTEDLESIAQTYETQKADRMDYDDLVLAFRDRLRSSPAFREGVASRLDHLFVDEYQDVNAAQAETVRLLTTRPGSPAVTVVGDPRQAIYGFRGASPAHLERFLEPYGKQGHRVALTTCFRSSRALVANGNQLLRDAHPLRPRPRAPAGTAPSVRACADEVDEALVVLAHVDGLLAADEDPAEIVVLSRSRHLAQAFLDEVAFALGEERRGRRKASRLGEVRVQTIHAAKGLEWDHVVVLGLREGGLPSEQALAAPIDHLDAALGEERRLLYVAATRARKSLLLTWPEMKGKRTATRSRFLAPLDPGGPLEAAPASGLRARVG